MTVEMSTEARNWHCSIQYHDSSVRFLRAGLYLDAIHSIMEGLDALGVSLSLCHADSSGSHLFLPENGFRTPMELTQHEMQQQSTEELPTVMIYNLGLAYHLYALTLNGHNQDRLLQESLKLYREAQRRINSQREISKQHATSFDLSAYLQSQASTAS